MQLLINYSWIFPFSSWGCKWSISFYHDCCIETKLGNSKRSKLEGKVLVERVSVCIGLVCIALSITVFVFAAPLVDSAAPGWMATGSSLGPLTRKIAILQLKVMAPCIMAAAFIGISFGSLRLLFKF
ncbi:hypothetical protein O6H91_Y526400 [Diphasiastrum complanatum]|nr:hypothetical protein O6H91_Y526400 [Diphasiastrum complanatum]